MSGLNQVVKQFNLIVNKEYKYSIERPVDGRRIKNDIVNQSF